MTGTLCSLLAGFLALVAAQAEGKLAGQWRTQRDLTLVDVAGRHYDVGAWCWKNGLKPQGTSQMLFALALSDGRYRPAKKALATMRRVDDAAWERDLLSPKATLLRSYAKRLKRAKEQDRRDFLELARWATKKKLHEEARAVYERLLSAEGGLLELDSKGQLRVGKATVPAEYSGPIHAAGVEMNGRRYLRDEFLATLPDVGEVFEAVSDELRVRSSLDAENAARLHAMGEALFEVLANELGGRPGERCDLFVFARRSDYDAYLDAAELTRFRYGSGVADRKTNTAAVCAEGIADLDALTLHELTHLFHFGLTRAVLPDWYAEGLAETYGGAGTFEWDGERLETGLRLGADHRVELSDPDSLLPLATLLTADAPSAVSEHGWLFYAQSWAFVRFLRKGAGPEVAARFRLWEIKCTGAALGADHTNPRAHDPNAARELFDATFGGELETLEEGFRDFVAELGG